MKKLFLISALLGFLGWLFGQKPPYTTFPKRPAFMWYYPNVEAEERAWKKWAQDARRHIKVRR